MREAAIALALVQLLGQSEDSGARGGGRGAGSIWKTSARRESVGSKA